VFPKGVFFEECDSEVEASILETGNVFSDLGASIKRGSFDVANAAQALNPKGLVIAAEAYYSNRKWIDEHFDELDPVVSNRIIKGRDVTAIEYLDIQNGLASIRKQALDFFDTYRRLTCADCHDPPQYSS
jgi:aspartyl-tRNA(Asn)/glutamyl-tRNA(Gln) amidotransferase subunit A